MTPPPPFGTFPKIHPFWCAHPSLSGRRLAKISLKTAFFAQKALFFWPILTDFSLAEKGGTPLPPLADGGSPKIC